MALPAADVLTKQFDLGVPTLVSRIIDIQHDVRGGYLALVDSPPVPEPPGRATILKFDHLHNLIHSFSFTLFLEPWTTLVRPAAMCADPEGIYVTGTVRETAPGSFSRVFVMKFRYDGTVEQVRVYLPRLVNGCKVPADVHCIARSIVRLPGTSRLMVLFQTSTRFTGEGAPSLDDSVGAAVFTINNDCDAATDMRRIFGAGQLMPSRLRVLPTLGPMIVGQTRVAYPRPTVWAPFWARVDDEGEPLSADTAPVGKDAVFHDIAEGTGTLLAVGTTVIDQERNFDRYALAARIKGDGALDWIGQYVHPPERFTCELTCLQALDGIFIAAGMWNEGFNIARPWLVRFDPSTPDLFWHKRYEPNPQASLIPSSFSALLFNIPDRVLAGGNMIRLRQAGPGGVTDFVPFLVVSESEPAAQQPRCSIPAPAALSPLPTDFLFRNRWMDRMGIVGVRWYGASQQRLFEQELLCSATP